MIEYIYFVKCPGCEDEHFDFFDAAKEFALGCLTKKPIITQVEVCRNDFGECTDSADLGTIWSWEDMMRDTAEPTEVTFSKDDFKCVDGNCDPEFDAIDNSVDFEPEISEVSAIDDKPDNFRKPIPEGMTVEELVEEMEENEDTVECVLCQDLFDKSVCRKELNLGWLCRRCADDLAARGEGPVFKSDNYWDFLDEEVDELTEASLSDIAAAANREFSADWNEDDLLDFAGVADDLRASGTGSGRTLSSNAQAKVELDNERAFKNKLSAWKRYQKSKTEELQEDTANKEFNPREMIEFEYEDLSTLVQGPVNATGDDWPEATYTTDYTYKVSAEDVATALWENFLEEEDIEGIPGGFDALYENEELWKKFLDENFKDLVDKYEDKLHDYFAEAAQDEFAENASWDDYEYDTASAYWGRMED